MGVTLSKAIGRSFLASVDSTANYRERMPTTKSNTYLRRLSIAPPEAMAALYTKFGGYIRARAKSKTSHCVLPIVAHGVVSSFCRTAEMLFLL